MTSPTWRKVGLTYLLTERAARHDPSKVAALFCRKQSLSLPFSGLKFPYWQTKL